MDRGAGAGTAVFLGDRLGQADPCANNFDAIRIAAALIVVLSHAFMVVSGNEASDPFHVLTRGQMTLGVFGVTVFFFVSGLLITRSFCHDPSIAVFGWKRALRLLPALAVLCVLTVFILGPATTTLSFGAYFGAGPTWSYLANIFTVLPARYTLPGVFDGLPMERLVNGSLWTIWYEVACYALVVCLGIVGLLRWPAVLVLWLLSLAGPVLVGGHTAHSGVAYRIVQLAELFRYFGAGMLVYLLRDYIRISWLNGPAFLTGFLLAIATPWFPLLLALVMPPLVLKGAYAPVRGLAHLTRHGDLSYGIYLYAFPVQQLAVLALPSAPWWLNFLAATPLTVVLALASWRLVERPALRLKDWRPMRRDLALSAAP